MVACDSVIVSEISTAVHRQAVQCFFASSISARGLHGPKATRGVSQESEESSEIFERLRVNREVSSGRSLGLPIPT